MKANWHYYIINTSNQENLRFRIISEGKDVYFKSPEIVTIGDGQKAYRISSLNTEAIEETYNFTLTLLNINQESSRLVDRLPFPDPNSLYENSDGEMQADIYIYI